MYWLPVDFRLTIFDYLRREVVQDILDIVLTFAKTDVSMEL